jgi:D-alanyl-D-alanine carboxypeptidase (penicillin-binding protein 5/6)
MVGGAQSPAGRRAALVGLGVVAGLVVLIVVAAAVAVAVEPIPPARAVLDAALPGTVPGRPLVLPLPDQGQAAVGTSSGWVLAASAAQPPQPLASVTKVMTAYVVLEDHPLRAGQSGPEITVTAAEAASLPSREREGQSLIPVAAGEQLTELQALEALLIPSADDVADLLALFDAGTAPAFVAKMNATARALGMTHTRYVDASGYDPGSRSKAGDQLVLARAAMSLPVLAQIVGSRSVTLPLAGTVANYNTLVGQDGFTGIKTGSTNAAGGCLVWSVTRIIDGTPVTLLGVVLGQRRGPLIGAALGAARTLTDRAFEAFSTRTVVPAGTRIFAVSRADRHTASVTESPLATVYPPGTPVRIVVTPSRPPRFSARTGPVAQVTLSSPDPPGRGETTGVGLARSLGSPSLGWRISHVLSDL